MLMAKDAVLICGSLNHVVAKDIGSGNGKTFENTERDENMEWEWIFLVSRNKRMEGEALQWRRKKR